MAGRERLRTESGCVSMTSMCRRMKDGGVKTCGFESCVEFCGASGDQSGLCDGDADGVGGHGVGGGGADGVLDEMVAGAWTLLLQIGLILLEWMVVAWLFRLWRGWKVVMEELEVR